jgi:DUF1680 family protein
VLDLPVSPRITRPDDRIDALRGTAAIEAGPLVLCAESIDQGGAELRDLVIDGSSLPRQIRDGAIVDGRLSARQGTTARTPDSPLPYGGQSIATTDFGQVSFIPYYHWAERGPAEMRVWLPLFEPEASAGVSEGVR